MTVTTAGRGFQSKDGCSFLYEQMTGDFDAKVRVSRLDLGQAGLMVRETLSAGSRNYNVGVLPLGGNDEYVAWYRDTQDNPTAFWPPGQSRSPRVSWPNGWIRLTRIGQTFTAYRSADGVTWEQFAETTGSSPFATTVLVGLCTTSSRLGIPTTADYNDFSLVSLADTTPPTITCPTNITVPAAGPSGAPVNFTVTATDDRPGVSISSTPASGTIFPIGTTTVNSTATDVAGNISTCSFTVTVTGQELSALGPTQVWIGLKNSDDVGTKFDLLAEVFKNGALIGSGQLNSVPGGSSGFNNAVLRTINTALPANVVFVAGDTLSFKLSVRIAVNVSGHTSGTARLWFNDATANSRVNATIGGTPTQYFLLNNSAVGTATGPGPKTTVDVLVNKNVGGNPFKPFGTWARTF